MLKNPEKITALLDRIEDVKKTPMIPAAFKSLLGELGDIIRDLRRDVDRLDRTLGNL